MSAREEKRWERASRLWETVEAAAIEVPGIRGVLLLGHRFGWRGLILIVLIVGGPLGNYSLLRWAVYYTVPRLAGDFGMSFEAEDWSFHPLSFKAVARNVQIRPEHDPQATPIFTAGEIVFQGDVGSTARGLLELASLRPFHTFNEITVRHGQINLERSLTGQLNWWEYAEMIPEGKQQELLSGMYRINTLAMQDVSIGYVEHVPGQSGSGIIESVRAELHVDGLTGVVTDVRQVGHVDDMPTLVRASARSADGTIDIEGKVGLTAGGPFSKSTPRAQPNGDVQYVSTSAAPVASGGALAPHDGWYYDLTIALHNIGAAAFTRTVPNARFVAKEGTLNGRLRLVDHRPICDDSQLAMENVKFVPNRAAIWTKSEFDEMQRMLEPRSVTRRYEACKPFNEAPPASQPQAGPDLQPPAGQPQFASSRGIVALAAAFNEQANEDAPPTVRRAVALENRRITGRSLADAAIADTSDRAAQQVGQIFTEKFGPQTGQAVQQMMSGSAKGADGKPDSSPVAKGAGKVGHGIKKFFGGKDTRQK